MQYCSTRGKAESVSDAQAIIKGLAPDGGLYVPENIPALQIEEINTLSLYNYTHRAAHIMARFLPSFSFGELLSFATKAYGGEKFCAESPAPVRELDGAYVLELFHGPTCAFKDFALQMLPSLLTASLKKTGVEDKICILTATSGDTGKAALCGFKDVEGTCVCVLYPNGGVSKMQRLQMVSQEGGNVIVSAVDGNFDSAQSAVKAIFSDAKLAERLSERGVRLSSANSINWGRLVAQVVYYVSAYCDLSASGSVRPGEKINICVPTGNFGNILSAWYAKRMGVPINKLICASNSNDVLTEFLSTGTYNARRDFYQTASPSMDILISSNLERLLYLLSDSGKETAKYMSALARKGQYSVSDELLGKLKAEFDCGCCTDSEAEKTIRGAFERGYLVDTHTAVALNVYEQYKNRTGDSTKTLIVSTASPFKFPTAVLHAIGEEGGTDDFSALEKLSLLSGLPLPKPLDELRTKPERFSGVASADEIPALVESFALSQCEAASL